MQLVRMIQAWSVYNADETAGFEDATAERLIKAGVAVAADAAVADLSQPDVASAAAAKPSKADVKAAAAASLPQQGDGATSGQS